MRSLRCWRSRPRKGSSRMASRMPRLCRARPSRTRCPSPPETNPPLSPRFVCRPAGSFFKSSCNSADLSSSGSGTVPGFAPNRRFSNSVRFQSCTAGSTQAVCARSSFKISAVQRSPIYKDSAACRPIPTQQQAEQTGFTCAGWAHDCHMTTRDSARSISSSTMCPARRTLTFSNTTLTAVMVFSGAVIFVAPAAAATICSSSFRCPAARLTARATVESDCEALDIAMRLPRSPDQ